MNCTCSGKYFDEFMSNSLIELFYLVVVIMIHRLETIKKDQVHGKSKLTNNTLIRVVSPILTCFCTFIFQTSIASITSNNYTIQETVTSYLNNTIRFQTKIEVRQFRSIDPFFLLCSRCFWCATLIQPNSEKISRCLHISFDRL
jgi:hypothetical protein